MHIEFSSMNPLMNHLLVCFLLSLINSLGSLVLMFAVGGCSECRIPLTEYPFLLLFSTSFIPYATRKSDQQQKVLLMCFFFF